MNYRQNKNKIKIGTAFVLLTLAVVILSLGRGRELFENVSTPLIGASANANEALNLLKNETKSRAELYLELAELKKENLRLSFENLNQDILRQQNIELKEQLGWKWKKESFTLSRTITRPPVTPFDSLTIETNKDVSFEKGQRVRITETVEIGRISTVQGTTAIVKLYTTTGTQTPVEINGDGPLVIAEGAGAGSYTLQVPRSFEVKKGDTLTRPGMDAVIIGYVESVEKSETDSFSLVKARLPVNLFESTWVYIETNTKNLP
ncbi:MAG: rod shape-determining protein MreC [Candidatus Paceibacterota bacterium]